MDYTRTNIRLMIDLESHKKAPSTEGAYLYL